MLVISFFQNARQKNCRACPSHHTHTYDARLSLFQKEDRLMVLIWWLKKQYVSINFYNYTEQKSCSYTNHRLEKEVSPSKKGFPQLCMMSCKVRISFTEHPCQKCNCTQPFRLLGWFQLAFKLWQDCQKDTGAYMVQLIDEVIYFPTDSKTFLFFTQDQYMIEKL